MKVVFFLFLLVGVVSAAPTSTSPPRLWETPEEFQASLDRLNGALDELDGDLIPLEFVEFIRSLTIDDFDGMNASMVEWKKIRVNGKLEIKNLIKENKGKFNGSDAEIEAAVKTLMNDEKFKKFLSDGKKAGNRIGTILEQFPDLNTRFYDAWGSYMFKLMIIKSWNDTSPAYAMVRSLSGSSNALQAEYLVAETYPTFSNSTKEIVDVFITKFTTHFACRKTALEECENKKTWLEPSEATQEEVDAAIAECQAQSKPKCKKWTLGTSLVRNFLGL